jgi:hypothetical protein
VEATDALAFGIEDVTQASGKDTHVSPPGGITTLVEYPIMRETVGKLRKQSIIMSFEHQVAIPGSLL